MFQDVAGINAPGTIIHAVPSTCQAMAMRGARTSNSSSSQELCESAFLDTPDSRASRMGHLGDMREALGGHGLAAAESARRRGHLGRVLLCSNTQQEQEHYKRRQE